MTSLTMASHLFEQVTLTSARTCKNINCHRNLLAVHKITSSSATLLSQKQISISWIPSIFCFNSLRPCQQRFCAVTKDTSFLSPVENSSVFEHINKTYHRKYNKWRRWRTAENLLKTLAFLWTSIAMFYITKDDEHLFWFTVGTCTSSLQSDNIVKVAGNKKKECSSDPAEGKSATRHPSAEKTSLSLEEAVKISQGVCTRKKNELGSPGLVVCVSVDGRQVYAEGFGYADLENEVPIQPDSVMRVASISKSITAVIVAKLVEEGKINLDEKVQHYVPDFPQKFFMGEKVDIKVSHVLNHTSGIRHYKRDNDPAYAFDKQIVELVKKTKEASLLPFYAAGPVRKKACQTSQHKKPKMPFDELQDLTHTEIYSKQNFASVAKALALFQDDPLMARPGTKWAYTTYGYTLLSAVVEAVAKQPFSQVVSNTFRNFGMKDSYLDRHDPIIYKRARNYEKNKAGKIVNCPYVDNSYKWAGGGLLSTPEDLVKFGNILLYSAQHQEGDPGQAGFLKASTMWKFWSPPMGGQSVTPRYGLGFELNPEMQFYGMCSNETFGAGHTGNAVGASSALLVLPRYAERRSCSKADLNSSEFKGQAMPLKTKNGLPQGVVVAVIVNLPSIDLRGTAEKIARTFEKVDFSL